MTDRRALLLPGFLDRPEDTALPSLVPALTDLGFDVDCDTAPPDAPPSARLEALGKILANDGRPTVLIGHCYGAWLAALAAGQNTQVSHVVGIAPTRFFRWPVEYDPARDTWRRDGVRYYERAGCYYAVPHALVMDAVEHGGAWAELRRPALLIAGSADERLPPESVAGLAEGFPDRRFRLLEGVQHDYRDHDHQIARVNSVILDWLTNQPRADTDM